jgi:hypothetical membrane protein
VRAEQAGGFLEGPGAGYLMLGAIAYSLLSTGVLVVLRLLEGSFAPWTHFISDLGVGSLAAEIVFALFMVLYAAAYCLFAGFLSRRLRSHGAGAAAAAAMVALAALMAIAQVVTGVFPFDPVMPVAYKVHTASAVVFFAAFGTSTLFYGIHELAGRGLPRRLGWTSLAQALPSLAFAVLFAREAYGNLPHPASTYLIQWSFFAATALWSILHGLYALKR